MIPPSTSLGEVARMLTMARRQVHGNVTDTAAPAPAVDEGTKVDRPTEA
jgi:hypothetical protein